MTKVRFLRRTQINAISPAWVEKGDIRDLPEGWVRDMLLEKDPETGEMVEKENPAIERVVEVSKINLGNLKKAKLVKLAEEAGVSEPDELTVKELIKMLKELDA